MTVYPEPEVIHGRSPVSNGTGIKYQDELLSAEKEARGKKLGIWRK